MSNGARGPGAVGKSARTMEAAGSSGGAGLEPLPRGEQETIGGWRRQPESASRGPRGAAGSTAQWDEDGGVRHGGSAGPRSSPPGTNITTGPGRPLPRKGGRGTLQGLAQLCSGAAGQGGKTRPSGQREPGPAPGSAAAAAAAPVGSRPPHTTPGGRDTAADVSPRPRCSPRAAATLPLRGGRRSGSARAIRARERLRQDGRLSPRRNVPRLPFLQRIRSNPDQRFVGDWRRDRQAHKQGQMLKRR